MAAQGTLPWPQAIISTNLNGVITASAYFDDPELSQLSQRLLERVDWRFIVFERAGTTLFRMAYNPDRDGDYVEGEPGYLGCWDMAAEQKMMATCRSTMTVDEKKPGVTGLSGLRASCHDAPRADQQL